MIPADKLTNLTTVPIKVPDKIHMIPNATTPHRDNNPPT